MSSMRCRTTCRAVKYPRTPGYRPTGEENKHNAWYVKTTVQGAPRGKLKGKTIVLKDNIMLAGVPMMNGAATLEGYVPDIDATVVTRMLDAGGTIVGKAHCEYFCLSGGSHTNATGPVHNPHKMGYSAGGSSSGSAVLVALGEADMALGGDQGGSIRMPSAFCGIYGMKPTHGLVPYTGIMPIEIYVDHTGPMTANVADNALLLEVIAGPDGYDPRQFDVKTHPYTKALEGGIKGHEDRRGEGRLRAGQCREAMSTRRCGRRPSSSKKLGATVSEVSIPMHLRRRRALDADRRRGPDADHDVRRRLRRQPAGSLRHQPDGLPSQLAQPRQRAVGDHQAVHPVRHLHQQILRQPLLRQGDEHHAALTAAYDAALADYDLLLMPTMPIKATELPPADAPRELYVERALEHDLQHRAVRHHAPSGDGAALRHVRWPAGVADAGRQALGRAHHLPAAYAFEQAGDWKKM